MEGLDPNKQAPAKAAPPPQKDAAQIQPKMQLTAGPPRGHHVMAVVAVATVTALLAGGVVWFWMNNNLSAFETEREQHLSSLETATVNITELTDRANKAEAELLEMQESEKERVGSVFFEDDTLAFATALSCEGVFKVKKDNKGSVYASNDDDPEELITKPTYYVSTAEGADQPDFSLETYTVIEEKMYHRIESEELPGRPYLVLVLKEAGGNGLLLGGRTGHDKPTKGPEATCTYEVRKK